MTCAINGERLNVASFGKHLTIIVFFFFFVGIGYRMDGILGSGAFWDYSILSFEAHLRSARYD